MNLTGRELLALPKKYLYDTDVLIDFFKNQSASVEFINNHFNEFSMISVITAAELYSGIKNHKEQEIIEAFLQEFRCISLTYDIAVKGGQIRHRYYKSHGVGLADALIAATAQIHHATLITLNKKHYPMVKDLLVPYRKN